MPSLHLLSSHVLVLGRNYSLVLRKGLGGRGGYHTGSGEGAHRLHQLRGEGLRRAAGVD